MIEITARLMQGAYLAGELIECAVTFTCPPPPQDVQSQGNEQEEILGLASAQIYCRCQMKQSNVAQLYGQADSTRIEQVTGSRTTAFAPLLADDNSSNNSGSSGGMSLPASANRIVSTTKPTILFCDLRLLPGESKTCRFQSILKTLDKANTSRKFFFYSLVSGNTANGRPTLFPGTNIEIRVQTHHWDTADSFSHSFTSRPDQSFSIAR